MSGWNWQKIKQMLSNTLRLNYLKIFTFFIHVIIQKKEILWKISKRTSAPVFIQLIMMKIKMNMKNRSHRNDRNRPRPRHGHKYSKHKKCFIIMILNYIKQHLSDIWSSLHEKVKQHGGWIEKKCCLVKKTYT